MNRISIINLSNLKLMILFLSCFISPLAIATYNASNVDNYISPGMTQMTVEKLINTAYQLNPNVVTSEYNVEAAESEVSAAKSQFLPTPSISYGNANQGRDNFSASITQPLWTGGKLTSGLEYAKARVESAKANVYEVKYKLALNIVDLWRVYQSKAAEEKVMLQTLLRYQHYQSIIKNRIEGGRSSETDLIFIRSRVKQAESDLATISADKVTALNNLSRIVGMILEEQNLEFSYPLNQKKYELDKYLDKSIQNSPTLKRLYSDIVVANRQSDVKKANFFPNVNLVASHQQIDNNTGSVIDNKIMVNIQYTPGAGFTNYFDYSNSAHRAEAMKYNLESEKIYLKNEISSTVISLNSALSKINLIKNQSIENNQVLESYTRQFEFGQKTWIDLLNAAREFSLSEILFAQLQASIAAYEWKLKIYIGDYN